MAKRVLKLNTSAFYVAVKATKSVSACYKNGLQAFERDHARKVICDQKKVEGSLFIDHCLAKVDQGNRWDYAFGYDGMIYFVEVHPASSSAVKSVIKKREWLKNWLATQATELDKLKATDCFHWLQSGKFDMLKQSPQYKYAEQNGLIPKPSLKLK